MSVASRARAGRDAAGAGREGGCSAPGAAVQARCGARCAPRRTALGGPGGLAPERATGAVRGRAFAWRLTSASSTTIMLRSGWRSTGDCHAVGSRTDVPANIQIIAVLGWADAASTGRREASAARREAVSLRRRASVTGAAVWDRSLGRSKTEGRAARFDCGGVGPELADIDPLAGVRQDREPLRAAPQHLQRAAQFALRNMVVGHADLQDRPVEVAHRSPARPSTAPRTGHAGRNSPRR